MNKISASIITYNEEEHIIKCIQSVAKVADEIVVLDSNSTDNTVALAEKYGARVFQRKFVGFTEQKNAAVSHCNYNFILSLDADEELSEELIRAILLCKKEGEGKIFSFNRLNHFNRKPIKSCGWYPDKKIRLFHKDYARWVGGMVHEEVQSNKPNEKIVHLKGDLLHYGFNNSNDLLNKMQKYATIYARENAYKKKVNGLEIWIKTQAAFFKNFWLKKGFADGYIGYLISKANANGVHYKYAQLKEQNESLRCSLIITTYNRPEALQVVLESALRQNKLPKEIIVADDGSGFETKELLAQYSNRIIPIKHIWQEDQGFRASHARNKAIAAAQEMYIILIDGDMVLPKTFIQDHLSASKKSRLVQGSRVLLSEHLSIKTIKNMQTPGFFSLGLKNRKNRIHSKVLSKIFSYPNENIFKVRSANISFWKSDAIAVNGFNEDFNGWGREDSEFVQRILNNGIQKFHPKFMASAYHLYHKESSRKQLPENEKILQETVSNKLLKCANGLNKYLN